MSVNALLGILTAIYIIGSCILLIIILMLDKDKQKIKKDSNYIHYDKTSPRSDDYLTSSINPTKQKSNDMPDIFGNSI